MLKDIKKNDTRFERTKYIGIKKFRNKNRTQELGMKEKNKTLCDCKLKLIEAIDIFNYIKY